MNFQIFEPDLFMEFFNTEVIKSRRDEEESQTTQVLADWPWLIAYWSKKQIIVGQKFRNAKEIEIPSKDEVISCLEELNLTVPGSGDMPYPTIEVACTPAELAQIETTRSALQTAANAGDLAAIDQLAAETHLTYALADTKKKVNSMNMIAVIHKSAEIRLLKSQIKNDSELTCDMDALKLEDPTCNNWDKYICHKLGSQLPAFYRQLYDAQDSNLKRSLKHTEQTKKCLDCLALLGEIKGITDAEEAIKEMDYHGCFMALDNHYMRIGSQDPDVFRKEAESFRIQPGQDLNSHLDLVQSSLERWLNIEHMELKLLQLGSQPTASSSTMRMSASKFVLDHPEVAKDNSYDMTDKEISAKGSHSVILLSEAKRFTLYSNSVKSSPRFKRIVEQFHTEDESKRTVRALIISLRNFEISNSGSEQLAQERSENKQWKRDLNSYLDILLKRDLSNSSQRK